MMRTSPVTRIVLTVVAVMLIALMQFQIYSAIQQQDEDMVADQHDQEFQVSGSRTVSPMLRNLGLSAEIMFDNLLKSCMNPKESIVVEVGSFDGLQCRQASQLGYKKVICFEPSPSNYRTCKDNTKGLRNVDMVNMAAGAEPGSITFHSVGGTGDHAGPINDAEHPAYKSQKPIVVNVTTLDEYLGEDAAHLYMVKIDTQGFDGYVMEGMKQILERRSVKYVLAELWPNAMRNAQKPCVDVLNFLLSFDYIQVYELRPLGHTQDQSIDFEKAWQKHPLEPQELCQWYEEIGDKFGVWTDILVELVE